MVEYLSERPEAIEFFNGIVISHSDTSGWEEVCNKWRRIIGELAMNKKSWPHLIGQEKYGDFTNIILLRRIGEKEDVAQNFAIWLVQNPAYLVKLCAKINTVGIHNADDKSKEKISWNKVASAIYKAISEDDNAGGLVKYFIKEPAHLAHLYKAGLRICSITQFGGVISRLDNIDALFKLWIDVGLINVRSFSLDEQWLAVHQILTDLSKYPTSKTRVESALISLNKKLALAVSNVLLKSTSGYYATLTPYSMCIEDEVFRKELIHLLLDKHPLRLLVIIDDICKKPEEARKPLMPLLVSAASTREIAKLLDATAPYISVIEQISNIENVATGLFALGEAIIKHNPDPVIQARTVYQLFEFFIYADKNFQPKVNIIITGMEKVIRALNDASSANFRGILVDNYLTRNPLVLLKFIADFAFRKYELKPDKDAEGDRANELKPLLTEIATGASVEKLLEDIKVSNRIRLRYELTWEGFGALAEAVLNHNTDPHVKARVAYIMFKIYYETEGGLDSRRRRLYLMTKALDYFNSASSDDFKRCFADTLVTEDKGGEVLLGIISDILLFSESYPEIKVNINQITPLLNEIAKAYKIEKLLDKIDSYLREGPALRGTQAPPAFLVSYNEGFFSLAKSIFKNNTNARLQARVAYQLFKVYANGFLYQVWGDKKPFYLISDVLSRYNNEGTSAEFKNYLVDYVMDGGALVLLIIINDMVRAHFNDKENAQRAR
ncbi:MAG: hypothetical protein FJZ16_09420, partial [Candidatus Omnitrophica bacterium]|nr:hypothetical protein [Candidatus Omnitrophota bacterium]